MMQQYKQPRKAKKTTVERIFLAQQQNRNRITLAEKIELKIKAYSEIKNRFNSHELYIPHSNIAPKMHKAKTTEVQKLTNLASEWKVWTCCSRSWSCTQPDLGCRNDVQQ